MARGRVKSFIKEQGFGTITVDGQDVPFDYDSCADFAQAPREGDIVEATVGMSRLKRPKASFVQYLGHEGPGGAAPAGPAPDLKAQKKAQIEKDLGEYKQRGTFTDVDAQWIVDQGLENADRLWAVARFYLRESPSAPAPSPFDAAAAAQAIAELFPDRGGAIAVAGAQPAADGKVRLSLRLVETGAQVAAGVGSLRDLVKFVNILLGRVPGDDRIFTVAEKAGAEPVLFRGNAAALKAQDPERVLPLEWPLVEAKAAAPRPAA